MKYALNHFIDDGDISIIILMTGQLTVCKDLLQMA